MIVIIIVNWDTIKRNFDEIKAYFIDKFSRIGELIASTMDQARNEKQRKVYFPYNPYDFNPLSLRCEIYSGTYNGAVWKWFDFNIMIYEWDEDYKNGKHYHILSHNDIHYWPNSQIPEPYTSRYF